MVEIPSLKMLERVDFYVLKSEAPGERDTLACRLAEKGVQQGLRVFVCTESAEQSRKLDTLMWSFSGPAFVPHAVASQSGAEEVEWTPVLIGEQPGAESHRDLLISLSPSVPENAMTFRRVADLIGGLEPEKQQGRERYRQYRERGPEPTIHNL